MLLSTPSHDPKIIAPNFVLPDVITGNEVDLSQEDLSRGFVVAFICNHCPYVQELIAEFANTAKRLQKEGIKVFAIMSNNYHFVTMDSPENMKIFAKQNNFTFPYLLDEEQNIAKKYDAICTPDFFGFNKNGEMRFRGQIQELEQAMLEIAENGSTTVTESPSRGCSIKWK